MKTYQVLHPVEYDKRYEVGSFIVLPDHDAENLLALKAIVETDETNDAETKPKKKK